MINIIEMKENDVITHVIRRTGNGPSDKVIWKIFSIKPLTDDLILEIISKHYPSQGYGPSDFYITNDKDDLSAVEVISNASCD